MRCCDCQFRNDCDDVENDNVGFSLCRIRLKKLIKIELKEKLNEDAKQRNEERGQK